MPDNDEPGRDYASRIAQALSGIVGDIRIVELPGLGEGEDIVDWFKMAGNDRGRLLDAIEGTPSWERDCRVNEVTVVNVDSESTDYPSEETPFPFHVLPKGFKSFTHEIGEALNIDHAIAASSALTILSGAIGNTIRISPRRTDYQVAPFMWHAIIARSGSGKSPLIRRLLDPIYKLQCEAFHEYQMAKRLSKPTDVQPTMKHLLVTDCTVEALSNVFESSPRGVIAHQDEIAGLILGLNQYKSRGNDRQQYIQLFNADSWKIDRKTGSRVIPNTGIAIIGGIQPKVFTKVFRADSIDDGLLPRFIFIHGSDTSQKFSRKELTQLPYWTGLIDHCYGINLTIGADGYVVPDCLSLDKDALDLFADFYDSYMNAVNRDENRGVFISKLVTHYTLKFAGIMHIIKIYEGTIAYSLVIDRGTIGQAIELAKFFMGQAFKTLDLYPGSKGGLHSQQENLISCLTSLEDDLQNGTLLLSRIVERYNNRLPAGMQCTPKKVGNMLRDLGLSTDKGTGNHTYLVWEPEKISRLQPGT